MGSDSWTSGRSSELLTAVWDMTFIWYLINLCSISCFRYFISLLSLQMSRNLVLVCSGLVSAAALFYVLSSKKTYDKDKESMRLKEELIALKERIHKRRIFFLKTASAMTVGIIIYVNAKALYKRLKSGHHHHHHHPCRD